MVSSTHNGAVSLKEHMLGLLTGFTLSTMIKQSLIHHVYYSFIHYSRYKPLKYIDHRLSYSKYEKIIQLK